MPVECGTVNILTQVFYVQKLVVINLYRSALGETTRAHGHAHPPSHPHTHSVPPITLSDLLFVSKNQKTRVSAPSNRCPKAVPASVTLLTHWAVGTCIPQSACPVSPQDSITSPCHHAGVVMWRSKINVNS